MSTYPSVPATVEIKRGRLVALVTAVAVAAAAVTFILVSFAFDNSTSAKPVRAAIPSLPSAADDARRVPTIMSLTPARLAGNALGTGYALPTPQRGPTVASVLASMSPQTREYTKRIMNLTFAELAAGAAGQP